MNKEVKQSKIDLSAIHSVMQKELDWKNKAQLLDRLFSESDDRELTMIKHQQWEEIESFISQAVDGNHPKVKGPALYRRFRRKQGKVNRMILMVLTRFLELIKSIDKRLHKIEVIPLNNYRHHDETAMQSENEWRATGELKAEIKDMRNKLNLLEEEINKIEKTRPSSGASPVNEA
jgi:hypothetical protein